MSITMISRRNTLKLIGAAALGGITMPSLASLYKSRTMLKRAIPSSGEKLPVVGLGTWIQFDVGASASEREPLRQVLKSMHQYEGKVIDSSPMYGNAERVVGDLTTELGIQNQFFYATKVWTSGKSSGINQMQASMRKMQRKSMDLMQIHNLIDWKTHLKTLREWKEKGKIRYLGITHYTDSSHPRLQKIIETENIDFVQLNYSIRSRNAEKSLLNTAKERGVAVIVNRPFEGGSLFGLTRGKEIPGWAKEIDINSWGQFFLKYILSHPAITCVIPGTSKPHHLIDNMQAGYGKLPDHQSREKMVQFIKNF